MIFAVAEYALKGGAVAELLGWNWLKALKWSFWYGLGWSMLSDASRYHVETAQGGYHEFGIGLGDMLNIFRFDLIWTSRTQDRFLLRFNLLQ